MKNRKADLNKSNRQIAVNFYFHGFVIFIKKSRVVIPALLFFYQFTIFSYYTSFIVLFMVFIAFLVVFILIMQSKTKEKHQRKG